MQENSLDKFAGVIDAVDAAILIETLEEGEAIGNVSNYLVAGYKREEFNKLQQAHGDQVTVACIELIAGRMLPLNISEKFFG